MIPIALPFAIAMPDFAFPESAPGDGQMTEAPFSTLFAEVEITGKQAETPEFPSETEPKRAVSTEPPNSFPVLWQPIAPVLVETPQKVGPEPGGTVTELRHETPGAVEIPTFVDIVPQQGAGGFQALSQINVTRAAEEPGEEKPLFEPVMGTEGERPDEEPAPRLDREPGSKQDVLRAQAEPERQAGTFVSLPATASEVRASNEHAGTPADGTPQRATGGEPALPSLQAAEAEAQRPPEPLPVLTGTLKARPAGTSEAAVHEAMSPASAEAGTVRPERMSEAENDSSGDRGQDSGERAAATRQAAPVPTGEATTDAFAVRDMPVSLRPAAPSTVPRTEAARLVSPPLPPEAPVSAAPQQNIHLRVSEESGDRLSLHFRQREGAIQFAVRGSSPEVVERLQGELNGLQEALGAEGFRAELQVEGARREAPEADTPGGERHDRRTHEDWTGQGQERQRRGRRPEGWDEYQLD